MDVTATAAGIVFLGAIDRAIRAFDHNSGTERIGRRG
jgi:hypothetical protein